MDSLLKKNRGAGINNLNAGLLFFAAGIWMAYFDFLTYPLVVYGIPALVLIYSGHKKTRRSACSEIKTILVTGISFVLGYVILFVSKWVMGYAAVGGEVLKNATEHVTDRMSGSGMDGDISRFDAITRNIEVFAKPPYILVFCVLLIFGLLYAGFKKRSKNTDPRLALLCIFFTVVPFIWFFVFANHSHAHYFFTHRILAISIFSIYTMIYGSCNKTQVH